MKISVKTLKGELLHIEAVGSDTVESLKVKIHALRSDFYVEKQKLIHAGKVLRDMQSVDEIGVKETDFIVCMVSKDVVSKSQAADPSTQSTSVNTAAPTTPLVTSAPVSVPVTAPSTVTPVSTTPAATATPATAQAYSTPAAVAALTSMGFPESESRSALEAAMGNPDLAYEFLLTGIPVTAPRRVAAPTSTAPASTSAAPVTGGTPALQQFRSHPQFEQLKQLVQTNPASLPRVLSLIGEQNPQLLEAIHANNDEFLAMMNEPIATPANPAPQVPSAGSVLDGGNNASNLVAMLSALPPEQRAQFAQQVGMSPQQLNSFVQMISQIPPDQLTQLMPNLAGGGAGAGSGLASGATGSHVIRLTEEEHAAVTRLQQLGFTQQQAVQAYLACDKNEALAANLLFDGGFGMDDDADGGGMGGYGDFGDEDE